MGTKMEEEQLEFLDELLDGTPQVEETQSLDGEPGGNAEELGGELEKESSEETSKAPADEVAGEKIAEETAKVEEPQDSVAILREQIVKLTEALNKDPLQQSVQVDVPSGEGTKEEKKAKLEAFLTDEEVDRIIDEPQLLNVAFNRAISVMQQNIQGVIQAEVSRQVMVSKAVSEFYTENQDLVPYGKFVQYVMSEIERENPNSTYAEIFQTTASEVRKRLGLQGSVQGSVSRDTRGQSPAAKQRPAFAGTKRGTQRPAGKQEWFDSNAADLFGLQ